MAQILIKEQHHDKQISNSNQIIIPLYIIHASVMNQSSIGACRSNSSYFLSFEKKHFLILESDI